MWNDRISYRRRISLYCREEAFEILQKTRKGEDLNPDDRYLVKCAVRRVLTDEEFCKFQNLLDLVRGYQKPQLYLTMGSASATATTLCKKCGYCFLSCT